MPRDVNGESAGEEPDTFAALAKSFELSPEYQCIMGWDGIVHRVNPAFSKAFDIAHEAVLGRQFAQLCHPEDRDAWMRHVTITQVSGSTAQRFACRLRTGSGTYINATWHIAADAERRLLYAFGRRAGP